MSRGGKTLSHEDRVLWGRIAKSTRPLSGRMEDWMADLEAEAKAKAAEAVAEAEAAERATRAPSNGPGRKATTTTSDGATLLPPGFGIGVKAGAGSAAAPQAGMPARKPAAPALHPIERPVHRKIARGRLELEARIDLHGLVQAEAHDLLHDFLVRAHERGMRHVLVITGKGRSLGSEGALKRLVPQWLAKPGFRILVSGYETAARGHGGEGALYIRLKRPRGEDPA